MSKRPDQWQLPQHELAGRPRLSEARIHRRREGVFLVLAALFVAATVVMPLLGATKVFGVTQLVRDVGLSPSRVLLMPLGAIAFPLALLVLGLACELYGRKRARALQLVGLVVSGGVVALAWATDRIPDYDGARTFAFGQAIAFSVCAAVTCFAYVEIVNAIGETMRGRHLWMRNCVGALLALALGWVAFAVVVLYVPRAALPALDGFTPAAQLASIAITASVYAALAMLAGSLPLTIVAGGLAGYLRISRIAPPEDDDRDFEPVFAARRGRAARSGASNSRPFTSQEREFFDEGEELANQPTAADSLKDLDRRR